MQVAGLPDSGFFLEYEGPFKYRSGLRWVYETMKASVDEDCVKALGEKDEAWRVRWPEISIP